MKIILNLLGLIVVGAGLYLYSADRKKIDYKLVIKSLVAQIIVAFLLVKFPIGRLVVEKVSDVITEILNYGQNGIQFVFGPLSTELGFVFAFTLCNIIFLSAVTSALYYLGILGNIVKVIGNAVGKLLGSTRVETFVAVANMFLGQTDSPILVAKYLKNMTRSEVMVVLVSGMGSMSATVIGGYVALGIPMKYLLTASAMVPIASIAISKVLLPETEEVKPVDDVRMDRGDHENLMDAISDGANKGLQAALAIGGTLIAFISIVAMLNGFFGLFNLSLEKIFSYVFSPIAYFMGFTGKEFMLAGDLLGTKLILNEFVAFEKLGKVIAALSDRSAMILTISLAGFANVGSIGICISGISVLSPNQRPVLARLAFRAMVGGFFVSVVNAMLVGLISLI